MMALCLRVLGRFQDLLRRRGFDALYQPVQRNRTDHLLHALFDRFAVVLVADRRQPSPVELELGDLGSGDDLVALLANDPGVALRDGTDAAILGIVEPGDVGPRHVLGAEQRLLQRRPRDSAT